MQSLTGRGCSRWYEGKVEQGEEIEESLCAGGYQEIIAKLRRRQLTSVIDISQVSISRWSQASGDGGAAGVRHCHPSGDTQQSRGQGDLEASWRLGEGRCRCWPVLGRTKQAVGDLCESSASSSSSKRRKLGW